MNFDDLKKRGEAALAGKDGKIDYAELGKDAQEGYNTYNKTEGSFADKAKAAYAGYESSHKDDKKEEEKKEEKISAGAETEFNGEPLVKEYIDRIDSELIQN
ncbi:hypothetical protein E0198_001289 [Clavispora lusitaniae]|nr:hypothetical protein E0198_001289 [Clavispora lusitaniae]